MSVAAELSRLRASSGITKRSEPPSVLHAERGAAAREPRVDAAGAALNALEALSAGDAALPKLAEALLLRDSREDRWTLEPDREQVVSEAVIATVIRLGPVYPLRAAQRVVEWLIRGLEAWRGDQKEVDAILVSSLPFHGTEQFVRLVQAVLGKHAPERKEWTWLMPVVDQGRPPDTQFVQMRISPHALRATVRQLADATRAGVAVAPLAAFVASCVGARMLGRNVVETRTLALVVLKCVCRKPNETTLAVTNASQHAKIAYMTALTVGIAAGTLDDTEVRAAILHAAVTMLKDETTRKTAATAVVICLARERYTLLPSSLAKSLAKRGGFAEALEAICETSGTVESFGTYLATLASLAPTHKRARNRLMEDLKATSLLSDATVTRVGVELLDAYSAEVDGDKNAKQKHLAELLAPLVRGRYGPAIDMALRKHFDGRRKKKRERARYAVVDVVLATVMVGTPFVAVKTTGLNDSPDISEDTLLHCLEHPERSVRLAGVQRLAGERGLVEAAQGTPLAETFSRILMRRLKSDSDLRVVTEILQSGLVATFCEPKAALAAIGERYRAVFAGVSVKKREKLNSRVLMFSVQACKYCGNVAVTSVELRHKVVALFIGLELNNMLPAEALKALMDDEQLVDTMKFAEMTEGSSASFVRGLHRFDRNTVRVLNAVASWDKMWVFSSTKVLCENWNQQNIDPVQLVIITSDLVDLVTSCALADNRQADNALISILAILKALPKLERKDFNAITKLWHVLSKYAKPRVIQQFVSVMWVTQGADRLFTFLIGLCGNRSTFYSRVFALQWCSAIVKSGSVTYSSESVVRRLLFALYADDQKIRTSAANICMQLELSDLGDRVGGRCRKIFTKLNLKPKVLSETDDEDWIAKYLLDQLYCSFPKLAALPAPLSGNILTSDVVGLCQHDMQTENDWDNAVFVLRALKNDPIESGSTSFVFKVLQKTLARGQELICDEKLIESLLRAVVIFPKALPGASVELKCITKLFITQAQSLPSYSLTANSALAGEAVLTGLFKCVALQRHSTCNSEEESMCNDVVSTLFWLSTLSSPIGEFASRLIGTEAASTILQSDFERVTKYLPDTVLNVTIAKRRRTPEPPTAKYQSSSLDEAARRASVTGVLEALTRMPPGYMKKIGLSAHRSQLRDNLWAFVRPCAAVVKSNESLSLQEQEYQLSLVLRILAQYYDKPNSKWSKVSSDDAMAAVDICFFPGIDADIELSATVRSLRAASVALVKSLCKLHSKALCEHIGPLLKHVVSAKKSVSNVECLQNIVPMLVRGGLEVDEFLKYPLQSNPSAAIKDRLNVMDCVRMCPNKADATAATFDLLYGEEPSIGRQMKILPECVKVLLHSGNTVDDILSVLCDRTEATLASLVMVVFGRPEFVLQLDAKLQRKEETFVHLNETFKLLFDKLLKSEDKSRQSALGALISIVPGSVICACVGTALESDSKEKGLRALQSLAKRLDVNTPIHNLWDGEASMTNVETDGEFSNRMCKLLGTCIETSLKTSSETLDPVQIDLGRHAIMAMRRVLKRSGQSHLDGARASGELLMNVVQSSSSMEVLTSALLCMAEVVKVLGKEGSAFVPLLAMASTDVIEEVLCRKKSDAKNLYHLTPVVSRSPRQSMSIALDGATRTCMQIFEVVPRMFGKKSLRRIAALASVSGKISALLYAAIVKVSPAQALDALTFALKCVKCSPCDAAEGIKILMESARKMVGKMNKREIKAMKSDILHLCLAAMEYRNELFTNQIAVDPSEIGSPSSLSLLASSEEESEQCEKAEKATCAVILDVVLKVPESEFAVMFNEMIAWSEAHELKLESECPPTILRLIPLQRLCLQFFSVLRKLFCPYYAGVLERALNVICTPPLARGATVTRSNISSNGKKRRREFMEQADENAVRLGLERMREMAVHMCLQNVELFLRCTTDELSVASLVKIQEGMLTYLDHHESTSDDLQRALCALAARMLVTGTYRTKEQSRDLIVGLSRGVLQRTRHEKAGMRRAALYLVNAVVDTLQDEYLVALPQAMPVLADIVDDEREDVVRIAKEFVRKLESLTGESILEQLK